MRRKSQSAMEYLMTYGWAILAIAIVMVSLYSLGIFNTGSLQPTASPGSCEVVRTAAQTSLAGQCSNLIPKYVAYFNGEVASYISVPGISFGTDKPLTLSVWAYFINNSTQRDLVSKTTLNYPAPFDTYVNNNQIRFLIGNYTSYSSMGSTGGSVNLKKWQQWTFVYNGTSMSIYENGILSGNPTTVPVQVVDGGQSFKIGNRNDARNPMYGNIANVQVYNRSLDNTSIKALYQEGIGGAPIDVNHIVGWWPLNGNANDYSGNDNQGTAINVTWNANWQSGYTAPTS